MPINVSYNPVGLLGTLAVQSGQAQGAQMDADRALRIQQMNLQSQVENRRLDLMGDAQAQNAQTQAFRLQAAYADRTLAGGMRTPAADHILERNQLATQARQQKQQEAKAQLDTLLKDGTIGQQQYEKALAGVMSGNEALINHAITDVEKPVKAPFTQNQQLQTELGLAKQSTRIAQSKLAAMDKQKAGGYASLLDEDFDTNYTAAKKDVSDALAEEQTIISEYGIGGAAGTTNVSTSVPSVTPIPDTGGTATMIPSGLPNVAKAQLLVKQKYGNLPPTSSPDQATPDNAPAQTETFPEGMIHRNIRTGKRRIWKNGQWQMLPSTEVSALSGFQTSRPPNDTITNQSSTGLG